MQRTLDYVTAWNDAIALFKAHREVAIAIAGVFVFLPVMLFGYMSPQDKMSQDATGAAALQEALNVLSVMVPWLIGLTIFTLIGTLAIFHIVLDADRPTAGQGLIRSGQNFFTVILARILAAGAIFIGLILLFVPGIYLSIKFCLTSTVVVAENIRNPVDALSRSWAVTKGNSIQIFGFLLVITVVFILSVVVVNIILGIILALALPPETAQFVMLIISSLFQTLFSLLMVFVYAAIYRQLTAS